MVFTAQFELSSLNGRNGFILRGDYGFDQSGSSVSDAGDINGDGFDDLIIGAPFASPDFVRYAGESYVVFGRSSGFARSLNLSSLDGSDGFVIIGVEEQYRSGGAVSSAGDVNGDGLDDLIIGAAGADLNGFGTGESYVVFGRSSGFDSSLNLSSLDGTNGFALSGTDFLDSSGGSVSSAGDVNGDGFDDLIIGAYGADPNDNSGAGESYVVFGRSSGFSPSLSLSRLNGRNGFVLNGIDVYDGSGFSVSSAGDVNGDDIDDLIIGTTDVGRESYVVFGRSSRFAPSLNLSSLDGSNGFVIKGIDENAISFVSVSNVGDVNGDGFDDVIIGAGDADPNGDFSGESYVVFGKSNGFDSSLSLSSLNGRNGFVLNGIDAGDMSGRSVSSAGDVNGDGLDDLIIGAFRAGPDGNESGESYVVFGRSSGFAPSLNLSSLNGRNGFVLKGIDVDDRSGHSVSGAGDVNGDGFDDLIIGAPYAETDNIYFRTSGESYVVFGQRSANEIFGKSGPDRIQGTIESDFIIGLGSNDLLFGQAADDTLEGGNGDDRLNGGEGNDLLEGNTGRDRLTGDRGLDTLVGGLGQDSFIFQAPNLGLDRIQDFQSGVDQILIRAQGFGGGLERGLLPEDSFVLGSRALDVGDRFLYDDETGRLIFDANGSEGGGRRAIAILSNTPNLTAADIRIV